jgi:glycosyltransferase involved in cell wall biosynthesis
VVLFPSLRDGGGAVVVEAMGAGRPVVCLDVGGPRLHVTDDCGIRVAADTVEQVVRDLAAALERLYLDAELRSRMGAAARRRAAQIYHWDRLGNWLLEIYAGAAGAQVQVAGPDGGVAATAASACSIRGSEFCSLELQRPS